LKEQISTNADAVAGKKAMRGFRAGLLLLMTLSLTARVSAEDTNLFNPIRKIDPLPLRFDPPTVPVKTLGVGVIKDEELVLGVTINADSRAYPLNMISGPWREIINDTLGHESIAVTWCSLCQDAIVFNRRCKDRTLSFGVDGSLWRMNAVMYDDETKSLWSQFMGEAKGGLLSGARLDVIPAVVMDWKTWRARYPESTVVVMDRTTESFNVDFHTSVRKMAIGINLNGMARAYSFEALKHRPVVNDLVGERPVVVSFNPESTAAVIFSRRVDQRVLNFESAKDRNLTDLETRSIWDGLDGRCLSGELAGKKLATLPSHIALLQAWVKFYPNSKILVNPPGNSTPPRS